MALSIYVIRIRTDWTSFNTFRIKKQITLLATLAGIVVGVPTKQTGIITGFNLKKSRAYA